MDEGKADSIMEERVEQSCVASELMCCSSIKKLEVDMSEKDTEQIVEAFYKEFCDDKLIVLERETSSNELINSLIKSKNDTGNKGFVEFIITSPCNLQWVMIVECKKDIRMHMSGDVHELLVNTKTRNKQAYAVDGCLHYMECIAPKFNVIGVAISGKGNNIAVTVFKQLINKQPEILTEAINKKNVECLLPFDQYVNLADDKTVNIKVENFETLRAYAKSLHEDCRNHFALKEEQKPLFVSALLLALQDNDFKKTFADVGNDGKPKTAPELINKIFSAIEQVLHKADVPHDKINIMLTELSFIKNDEAIRKLNKNNGRLYIVDALIALNDKVLPYMKEHANFDLVGMFYGEFVSFTGGDGKGLGIVLTPRHITELMCKLARIDCNSIVIDPCCGTASFLITAMKEMIDNTYLRESDQRVRDIVTAQIKKNNLIGIETKGCLYTMAAANMIFRGDGKTNLIQDSCFSTKAINTVTSREIIKIDYESEEFGRFINKSALRTLGGGDYKVVEEKFGRKSSGRPNKCLMNPPFSQEKTKNSGENLSELEFISNALEMLENGGTLVCIVPIRVAYSSKEKDISRKNRILEKHTLEAVLSMPSNLFYPTGTHTCIMVFTAHVRHNSDTWLAHCKDDGFVIDRILGRSDKKNKWPYIFNSWVEQFMNKDTSNKYFSICKRLTGKDEWCSEAYIETDFEQFTDETLTDFITKYQLSMLNTKLGNI